jgi:hypothetical protein
MNAPENDPLRRTQDLLGVGKEPKQPEDASPLGKVAQKVSGCEPLTCQEQTYQIAQTGMALQIHFEAMRRRVHEGLPMNLTLDHPYKRMLWYQMLVPPAYQETYSFEEWEADLLHDEFRVVRESETTCFIWMANRRLTGTVPVVIDHFFSVPFLCGHYPEEQEGLAQMWRMADGLRGVA